MKFLSRITASAGTPGVWSVVLIRAGRSENGRVYEAADLKRLAEAGGFEGRPAMAFRKVTSSGAVEYDHVVPNSMVGRTVANQIGVYRRTRWNEAQGQVEGQLHLLLGTEDGQRMDAHLRALESAAALESLGLSIDGEGPQDANGRVRLSHVTSVDLVSHPSAGGAVQHRIAASRGFGATSMRTLLALLVASHARLVEGYTGAPTNAFGISRHIVARAKADATVAGDLHTALGGTGEAKRFTEAKDELGLMAEVSDFCARLTEGEQAAVAKATKDAADAEEARRVAEAAAKAAGAGKGTDGPPNPEDRKRMDALEKRVLESDVRESRTRLNAAAVAAKLPAKAAAALLLQHGDRVIEAAEVARLVEAKRAEIDEALHAAGGTVTIVRESRDRNVEAMAHLLSPRCKAPQEGVGEFRGSMNTFLEKRFGIRIREAFISGETRVRAREAVDSTNFDAVFAEALNRSMLAEYRGNPALDMGWRRIVNVVSESDFRTKEVIATTQYGELPDVVEDGIYQPLTTPTDRKESYALSKKGGLESITMEKMLNDDLGLWRSMVRRIGVAARQTISEAVFALLRIATMPTMQDTYKLMSASRASPHTNLDTNPLTADATGWGYYVQGCVDMAKKTNGGVTGLGVIPKILVIPFAKAKVAGQLFSDFSPAQAADIPTRRGLEVIGAALPEIVIDPGASNTTDWFQLADPADAEVIRVAFLNGQEDPQIIIADGQGFGSMFARDKVELKARHIFKAAAVDHIGAQGHDAGS